MLSKIATIYEDAVQLHEIMKTQGKQLFIPIAKYHGVHELGMSVEHTKRATADYLSFKRAEEVDTRLMMQDTTRKIFNDLFKRRPGDAEGD